MFGLNSYSQSFIDQERYLPFAFNHFSFNQYSSINFGEVIPRTSGAGEFEIRNGSGIAMGILHTMNPYPNLGIETGVTIGIQRYAYSISASADDFPFEEDFYEEEYFPEPYLSFPLTFVPRFTFDNKNWWYVQGGIAMNFYLKTYMAFGFSTPYEPGDESICDLNIYFPAENPYALLKTGLGWMRLTKNKDFVQVGIDFHAGLNNVMTGGYQFNGAHSSVNSSGRFASKGSYVSLKIGYIFTNAKRLEDALAVKNP